MCADWEGVEGPHLMGTLFATRSRGREIFSFEYDRDWLEGPHRAVLDPDLRLFRGPQYPPSNRANFGLFLDSCPDRWGRVLMERRESVAARAEDRPRRRLHESDFLLGVHDRHRMGGLRFRTDAAFLDDNEEFAAPPWTSLRELETAARLVEESEDATTEEAERWIRMLIAPGGSLGGARPKASVLDENGNLWIAKFPSGSDEADVGAWEGVVHELARDAGVVVPPAQTKRFASKHHTFLTRRFDRPDPGTRLHFASAMTMLDRQDGEGWQDGVSYLELVEFLIQHGAQTHADLEELWRRIVFSICVSNTDDHLRNHGFVLTDSGWRLSPAYDLNPDRYGDGLRLAISETDNAQSFELATEVAPHFRLSAADAEAIIQEVRTAVGRWRAVASQRGLSSAAQDRMAPAFRLAEV